MKEITFIWEEWWKDFVAGKARIYCPNTPLQISGFGDAAGLPIKGILTRHKENKK